MLLVEFVPYEKDLGNELLLGFRASEAFGPVISFSKGGSDAEYFATHFSPPNLILPPIDRVWTEALLKSTKIHHKYIAEGQYDHIKKLPRPDFFSAGWPPVFPILHRLLPGSC